MIHSSNHSLNRQTQRRGSALVAGLLLGSLWLAPVALAEYSPSKKPSAPVITATNTTRYIPPKTPSAPKATTTNTTRRGSCESNSTTGLTALVPFSHVGQTSSQHPTFTWFVPDRTPRLLEFRLFTGTGQLLYKTQMQSQPGIMSISLPLNRPALAIGQLYQWQVVLICEPNVPTKNVVMKAEIQVVKPDAWLQTQLDAASTPQQRIDLYAESGLWYDAIREALKASGTSSNQPAVLELLDALATSEAQPLKEWSDRLTQIQTIERQRQDQRQPSPPKL